MHASACPSQLACYCLASLSLYLQLASSFSSCGVSEQADSTERPEARGTTHRSGRGYQEVRENRILDCVSDTIVYESQWTIGNNSLLKHTLHT